MHAIRSAAFAAMLAAAPVLSQPAHGQSTPIGPEPSPRTAPRYFELVNASHDSVTAVAIAPAGSDAFQDVDLGDPLRGGVTAATLDVPAGGCLRDFRVRFRNDRTLLYPAIDLCRASGMRLTPRDARGARPETGLAARVPAPVKGDPL